LDLGASPGSWSQYAAGRVAGEGGRVLALDLVDYREALGGGKPPTLPGNVVFHQADAFEPGEAFEAELAAWAPFDVVLSDMAPKTTGVMVTDQSRSLDLAMRALALARERLAPGGSFVVKVFMGPDVRELTEAMRECFAQVRPFKPKSSRAESKEMFYLGLGFRGPAPEQNEPGKDIP